MHSLATQGLGPTDLVLLQFACLQRDLLGGIFSSTLLIHEKKSHWSSARHILLSHKRTTEKFSNHLLFSASVRGNNPDPLSNLRQICKDLLADNCKALTLNLPRQLLPFPKVRRSQVPAKQSHFGSAWTQAWERQQGSCPAAPQLPTLPMHWASFCARGKSKARRWMTAQGYAASHWQVPQSFLMPCTVHSSRAGCFPIWESISKMHFQRQNPDSQIFIWFWMICKLSIFRIILNCLLGHKYLDYY